MWEAKEETGQNRAEKKTGKAEGQLGTQKLPNKREGGVSRSM